MSLFTQALILATYGLTFAAPAPQPRAALWQPAVGASWNYPLSAPPTKGSQGISIWGVDLFDTPQATIDKLHAQNAKVICYFSAGSAENWRSDFNQFQAADLGSDLDGWEGERWVQTKSTNVRSIMAKRLDLAVTKKCDGVDPDNIDAYNNDNGLGLTQSDAVNYVNYLAIQAKNRTLSMGLKNSGEIISKVISLVQWSINEECANADYRECQQYQAFIAAGKPVFHVEYPKGSCDGSTCNNNNKVTAAQLAQACNGPDDKNKVTTTGFSTIVKNINLNSWIEFCNGTAINLA